MHENALPQALLRVLRRRRGVPRQVQVSGMREQAGSTARMEAMAKTAARRSHHDRSAALIFNTTRANRAAGNGCNCSRSGCMKSYCVCYKSGLACGTHCKCTGCANCHGTRSGASPAPADVVNPPFIKRTVARAPAPVAAPEMEAAPAGSAFAV